MPPADHPCTWRAHYEDGETLDEYADGESHGIGAIDQTRLRLFELVPADPARAPVAVQLRPGSRLIFYRRIGIPVDLDGDGQVVERGPRQVWTVLGWQKTVGGRNVKSFLYGFPDGSSLLSDDPHLLVRGEDEPVEDA